MPSSVTVCVFTGTSTQPNTPLSHCSVDDVLDSSNAIIRLVAASDGRLCGTGVAGALSILQRRLD